MFTGTMKSNRNIGVGTTSAMMRHILLMSSSWYLITYLNLSFISVSKREGLAL